MFCEDIFLTSMQELTNKLVVDKAQKRKQQGQQEQNQVYHRYDRKLCFWSCYIHIHVEAFLFGSS